MLGTRVFTWDELFKTPGGYMLTKDTGGWFAMTPNGHLGNLNSHEVTEHEDGTVTVSPSILVSGESGELYHGFLREGEWVDA